MKIESLKKNEIDIYGQSYSADDLKAILIEFAKSRVNG